MKKGLLNFGYLNKNLKQTIEKRKGEENMAVLLLQERVQGWKPKKACQELHILSAGS